jgi:hypothetical protein
MPETLDELWAIARQYGRVALFTNCDGTYHAKIEFNTIEHTSLEAKSDFKQGTPNAALRMAIGTARSIVQGVKELAVKLEKEDVRKIAG